MLGLRDLLVKLARSDLLAGRLGDASYTPTPRLAMPILGPRVGVYCILARPAARKYCAPILGPWGRPGLVSVCSWQSPTRALQARRATRARPPRCRSLGSQPFPYSVAARLSSL